MAKIAKTAFKVSQYWRSQGLKISSVEPKDLVALRHSLSAALPTEYEEFLCIAGLPDDEDTSGFRFWLPQELTSTKDVLAGAGYRIDDKESSVVIADYLQESWWYALWLSGPYTGHVSLVLGREHGFLEPLPPLGTIVEFLLAYLDDDVRMYPPSG